MPIMAVQDQNDARGSARLLARTTKRYVDRPSTGAVQATAANNFYRLLEAYRAHGFLGADYEPHPERGKEALTLLPTAERHVADLRKALDGALGAIYGGGDPEGAIDRLETVLRNVAFPEKQPEVPAEDRKLASAFLGDFIDRLYEHH